MAEHRVPIVQVAASGGKRHPSYDGASGNGDDGGAEPPDNGYMEARVAKLEDFAKDTGERLARVETKLDHIEKEVGSLKGWLIGSVVTILFTVIGMSIGIQQMTVATFQGAAQVARESAPNAAQLPPIIINVPGAAPAAPMLDAPLK